MGEITEEKLSILREADAIFREEIVAAGLEKQVNQYFAVLTNVRSVGVMGDERTYESCVALRAVTSTDGMTADQWLYAYCRQEASTLMILPHQRHPAQFPASVQLAGGRGPGGSVP